MIRALKNILKPVLDVIRPSYHFCVAILGHALYGFPSKKITVVGVTGTKGKSSTVEFLNSIFETAGKKTAVINSIRFKIGEQSDRNTMRMSMPGRFFIARFLSKAVKYGCDYAIIEMTSEGAHLSRHRGIDMDGLIFTNLSPEHIESHGSLQKYKDAKFALGLHLARSKKNPRIMVAHALDAESPRYLNLPVEKTIAYQLKDCTPWEASERGGTFTFQGHTITTHLPGEFSLKNALAAATMASALGFSIEEIKKGIESLTTIPGRAEKINAGQQFDVVVDYAHTPDSLQALYEAYGSPSTSLGTKRKLICVLGNTGGGRDKWKRPAMGKIADDHCDVVILTNEDPYEEDPREIVEEMKEGMQRTPEIIMDRREAIEKAISLANPGDAVLITGKGTDPCICGPNGSKEPWSDRVTATEALNKAGFHSL